MAIDSEVKRRSIAAIANPWNGPSVVPDGTIDNFDRQAIAWSYAGILAGTPPEVVLMMAIAVYSAGESIPIISGASAIDIVSGDDTIPSRSNK